MEKREEFWDTLASELIMDLLIDVTGRSSIMEALIKIDPDYQRLEKVKEVYKQAYENSDLG